jgi:hypothetical protein
MNRQTELLALSSFVHKIWAADAIVSTYARRLQTNTCPNHLANELCEHRDCGEMIPRVPAELELE